MDTQIAVIILNYKTPEMTIGCLASIEGEIEDGVLVLVVDNNSGDGSCEKIEDSISQNNWGGWCRLIPSEVNGGFAAGNNIGIRAVEAEAYVLLNSDTIVRPGTCRALREALKQNPGVGLVAPRIENVHGDLDQNTFRYVTPFWELMRAAQIGPITSLLRQFDVIMKPVNKPFEPQWVGFACVVIRKEVIDQVGLLDESFFMYFEDIDYCRRARAKGWGILYWPEARVVHLLGSSSGVTKISNLRRRPPKYYYEARANYFKKHYGMRGLIAANILWTAGRCVSYFREKIGSKSPTFHEYESWDIWTGLVKKQKTLDKGGLRRVLRFFKDGDEERKQGLEPPVKGSMNANPFDISFLRLLEEDFRTHDKNLLEPGFWAVAVHRFGNWRMGIRHKALRAPCTVLYRLAFTWINWFWGIDLAYSVKLGRRVRIWHHGGMVLGAQSIGDDVHIRHGTTFGLLDRNDITKKPVIEDRVDIGAGACIFGDVTVGHDSVVGANSVVVRDVAPNTTVFGVPARRVNLVVSPQNSKVNE